MFGCIGFCFFMSICIALSTSDTQPAVIAANNAAVEMTVLDGLADDFLDIFRTAYRQAMFSAEEDGYFEEYQSTEVPAGKDDIITNRRKRSPLTLAARAYAAVQKLIKGATTVPANSKRYRLYEKTGDFERAKADFESVSPRNVKDLSGRGFNTRSSAGKIYTGLVGDRRIFLREIGVKGDKFRPTIEVSEAKMGSGPYVDKIVYKRKE